MAPNTEPVTPIQACLQRLQAGELGVRGDLIRLTQDRLLALVRAALVRFPAVRRWEGSDDVLQNVMVRLDRCLAQLPVESTRDYLCLASTHIRRELIDLARRYRGPEGVGANHATPHGSEDQLAAAAGPDRDDPAALAAWSEVHERIAALPAEEREVFDLHWYHGLSQEETAAALGVSVRTVRRRWLTAKLRLAAALGYGPTG